MATYEALPWFYRLLFLWIEPAMMIAGAAKILHGPAEFWQQMVPPLAPHMARVMTSRALEPRTLQAMYQMASAYIIIGLAAHLVLRSASKLPRNLQGRVVGSLQFALLVGDFAHISATYFSLPLRQRGISEWNFLVTANIIPVAMTSVLRLMWFTGIGRVIPEVPKSKKA